LKLIYKGKFDGNTASLPTREHMPGAVKFKEFDNPTKMAVFANILCTVITLVFFAAVVLWKRFRNNIGIADFGMAEIFACILPMLCLFPHEILHGICFRETVYLYTNLSKGMLFVVGTETMSKSRFVFMSLLPNLVFGVLPLILFFVNTNWLPLGIFGAITIGMGAGDYYNVFNALTQMPKGARTYLYQFNSYWYIPQEMQAG